MKIPKGRLIVIGGAEDKGVGSSGMANLMNDYVELEILKALVPSGNKGKIEIITTASSVPKKTFEAYIHAFELLNFKNVQGMDIYNREEASIPEYVERIKEANTVLLSGGDQFKLSTILSSTEVMGAILHKYKTDRNFTIAGTSAGAMA
nr:Type 1 glutamine amidotransferase-like domain-containing protein [Bacteroidota bacterium]